MKKPALLAALAIVVALPCAAQAPNRWTETCQVDRMTDKSSCGVQILVLPPGAPRDALLSVLVDPVQQVVLVIGLRYGSAARLRVDTNAAVGAAGCDRAICALPPKEARPLIRQMLAGRSMLVEFVNVHGEKIGPHDVSLAGFADEYRRQGAN